MDSPIEAKLASTKRRFKPDALLVDIVGILISVLDQLTKNLVVAHLDQGSVWYPLPALGNALRIVHSIHTGTACGYLPQLRTVFTFAPFLILAIVILFYHSQKQPSWLLSIGAGLIVGGTFGNLLERLRYGYVVVVIQIGTFPVFNIADASVSTAVGTASILKPSGFRDRIIILSKGVPTKGKPKSLSVHDVQHALLQS